MTIKVKSANKADCQQITKIYYPCHPMQEEIKENKGYRSKQFWVLFEVGQCMWTVVNWAPHNTGHAVSQVRVYWAKVTGYGTDAAM